MTDDKIPFLRARLDEDEQVAKAAGVRSPEWRLARPLDNEELGDAGLLRPAELKHAERHDPARTLREVPVKRARLALYEDALKRWGDLPRHERGTTTGEALRIKVTTLEVVIQGDMQSYARHPDFKEEWRM